MQYQMSSMGRQVLRSPSGGTILDTIIPVKGPAVQNRWCQEHFQPTYTSGGLDRPTQFSMGAEPCKGKIADMTFYFTRNKSVCRDAFAVTAPTQFPAFMEPQNFINDAREGWPATIAACEELAAENADLREMVQVGTSSINKSLDELAQREARIREVAEKWRKEARLIEETTDIEERTKTKAEYELLGIVGQYRRCADAILALLGKEEK